MNGAVLILVIILTVFAVYNILIAYGVFEFSSRPKKIVSEIEDKRKKGKKRKREQTILSIYASVIDLFRGIFMNDLVKENHEYYIQRLELRTKYLGRLLTPEEVRGKYALVLLASFFTLPLALFNTLVIFIPVLAFIYFKSYETGFKMKIMDEDSIIDDYFIDIYLLLYSKLRQGSRARLQGTVENYINTLETSKQTRESAVMMKFARYFLNLLSLYEDHVAVPHLRDYYKSATIINFCNVATQSLNGVENFDNLITFKMQLTERRTNMMRKRQQQILRSGERSIYAIWAILFVFIVVGWYSKLPLGAFGKD